MYRQWDVVVIGAGAAGLAAARTAAGEGLSCACIEQLGPGGVLMNLGHVAGYEDASPDTTGADLSARLMDEAMEAGVEMLFGPVRELAGDGPWVVRTDDEEHEAKAVVIATGLSAGSLGVHDEESFEGRGLSHCASCDGPLFAGQHVVVTGNDRWMLKEAEELSGVAERVTVIGDLSHGTDHVDAGGSITVLPGRITALKGRDGLNTVVVEHAGRESEIEAQGVFAYLDRRPVLDFAAGRLNLDTAGRIVVDENLRACVPFLFAAGDVRSGAAETVSGAVADGRRAGIAVARLLKEVDTA